MTDADDCCRLCLSTNNLSNIFEIKYELFEYIGLLTGIKVSRSDCLTTNICNKCVEFLKKIHSFKLMCIVVEKTLNEKLLNTIFIKCEYEDDHQHINPIVSNEDDKWENNEKKSLLQIYVKDTEIDNNPVDQIKNRNIEDNIDNYDCYEYNITGADVKLEETETFNNELVFYMNKHKSQHVGEDDKCEQPQEKDQKELLPQINNKDTEIDNNSEDEIVIYRICDESDTDATEENIEETKKFGNIQKNISKAIEVNDGQQNDNTKRIKSKHEKILRMQSDQVKKYIFKYNQISRKNNRLHYPCEICGRLIQKRYLVFHMNKHNNIYPYECKTCKKKFHHPNNLKLHLVVHDKSIIKNWHFCDVCGKKFSRRNVLKNHKTYHFPPTIPCNKCDQLYRNRPALRKHQITHSQERNYKCKVCKKAYLNSWTLKVHMRIHTNEKPFKCTFCDKKFAYKCLIKDHIAKYHTEIS